MKSCNVMRNVEVVSAACVLQYARLPMSVGLDTGIKFGVSLYFNIYAAKKPTATYVDGRTNAPLKVRFPRCVPA